MSVENQGVKRRELDGCVQSDEGKGWETGKRELEIGIVKCSPLNSSTSSTRLGVSKSLGKRPSSVESLGWISTWRIEGVIRLFATWALAFMLSVIISFCANVYGSFASPLAGGSFYA